MSWVVVDCDGGYHKVYGPYGSESYALAVANDFNRRQRSLSCEVMQLDYTTYYKDKYVSEKDHANEKPDSDESTSSE